MKQFLSTDLGSYTFDASAQTVTFAGVALSLKQILMVVNATRGIVIYNPFVPTLTGTLAGSVLTLTYDTTGHDDADQLTIIVDVPAADATPERVTITNASITVTGGVTANAGTNLNTSALSLESGGNLAALVAKDFATQTTLALILAKDFATQTTLALVKAKTDNLDVLLSTRTKPSDQQHVIIDSSAALTVGGSVTVSNFPAAVEISNDVGDPIPIEVATLPLPANAATEATLALVLTTAEFQTRMPLPGQATMASSLPVVIASNQSTLPISVASLPLPAGAATEATLGTRLSDATFTNRIPTLGQTNMAGSLSVVIASNQSALSVTLPASATLIGKVGLDQTTPGTTNGISLSQINGVTVSTANGLVGTGVQRVVIASDQTPFGVTIATVPLPTGAATEVTLSGLLTLEAFNDKTPAIGQGAMTGSSPVVIASDQSPVKFKPVDSAAADLTSTKGTQLTGARWLGVQDLVDTGRNIMNFFMALPIAATSAEVMMQLTGYKSGAIVAATATPAVITTGKTFRMSRIWVNYAGLAAVTILAVRMRVNLAGVAVIGSPLFCTWFVGVPAAVAGVSNSMELTLPNGIDLPAASGFAFSIQGYSATAVAAAGGFAAISCNGFEY